MTYGPIEGWDSPSAEYLERMKHVKAIRENHERGVSQEDPGGPATAEEQRVAAWVKARKAPRGKKGVVVELEL